MKAKLFFLFILMWSTFLFSQFSTGTVSLPTTGMTVKLDTNPTTVTLTLTGDSNSMLAVAFNATAMADLPDGFIYNSTANRDYKLTNYSFPTADTSQDWTQVSNIVAGTTRTIVATRSLTGGTGDFAFLNAAGNLDIIYARRAGNQAVGSHGNLRDATTLTFSPTLSVDEISIIKESFKILQNPVKNNINFEISTNFKYVSIYDLSGKKLKVFQNKEKSLNVSDLKSGVYFLEVHTENNGSFFEKFVKD